MRRAVLLLALAIFSQGCATISNISKLNRYLPTLENLAYLQDYADTTGQPVSTDFCGIEAEQANSLARFARLMGWTEADANGALCLKYIYTPKTKRSQ